MQKRQFKRTVSLVEGDGFEPSKSSTTDLQSAPFGHSGTPPQKLFKKKKWSRLWDSNPQPADYKSAALPIELNRLANVHYYTKIAPICQQYFRNISPISAKICIIFTIISKICWNWLLHRQYCRNTAPYGRLYRPTN